FFFFQAEDGIRDFHVTGVQTCALPIWARKLRRSPSCRASPSRRSTSRQPNRSGKTTVTRRAFSRTAAPACWPPRATARIQARLRSEERRVGKGRRAQGVADRAEGKDDR